MTDSIAAPAERYAHRAQHFASLADGLERTSSRVANLRGVTFVAALTLGLYALFGDAKIIAGVGAAVCAGVFGVCIVWHSRVIAAWEGALRWWTVNEHGRLRTGPDWRTLPDLGEGLVPADHPNAADLDLFGKSSLFQRINVAHTRFGQRALARYLTTRSSAAEILSRQSIAQKLRPEIALRQELEAHALSLSLPRIWARSDVKPIPPPDPEPLLHWAEAGMLPRFTALQVWALRALPLITLTGVLLSALLTAPKWLWGAPLAVQIVILFRLRGATLTTFHSVSQGQGVFAQYGPLLRQLARFAERVPELQHLRGNTEDVNAPERAMKSFERWVGWLELRQNPLVHPVVNAFLLWDIHCLVALSQWQQKWGRALRGWFEALGELEALSSLAGVASDNPDYAWPTFDDSSVRFEADDLAHPLIDGTTRVGNTVSLPAGGRALLITGSNMSGKSTLLRAMGLAQVMALAGAPVCARALRTSAFVVRSSLRISDSLEQGVSHFYAELRKLKGVVEAAREDSRVLFLLDEILHGTNSLERQVGARWVLAELLRLRAVGAVSTHDTGLCELPPALMQSVTQVHFREQVEGGRMVFDYTLRPGPVQGGNALRLMRMLGLDVPLEEGQ